MAELPSPIPVVTTERLVLRALEDTDAEALHRIMGETDVLRYFPNPAPPSLEKVREMIEAQRTHWNTHGHGWWAVTDRDAGTYLGWSGLQYLPETDETEVAFLLGQESWGRGLATEAGRAGLRFGFETHGLASIVAIVHPENRASRRVIEKLGMIFVDEKPYFGMDCCRYRIERDAFTPPRPAGEAG
jgi:ribosomal-protein-alanine N-acetyltransferase